MYIETERLILRRMTQDDFEDFCEYAPDPERCRMMGTEPLKNLDETREIFQWLLFNEKRFYAIVLKDRGKCVGHIEVQNFTPIAPLPQLAGKTGRTLSFCVSKYYRRQGYAFEALTALIGYLFGSRGVDYLSSGYLEFNEPSKKLHEKLGFRPIATTAVTLPGGEAAIGIETVLYNPAPARKNNDE